MKLSLSEVFVSNIIVTLVISNKSCCKHVLFTNLSDFISTTTRVTSLKSKKFLFCSSSVAKFGIAPSGRLFDQTVTFTSLLLEDFTFKCSNAEDIRDVVDFFLKGLKDRSQYAVATGSYKPLGGGAGLRRGDLVRMAYDQSGATLLKTGWCVGTNERTKVETDWPLESLHLVPTLTRWLVHAWITNKIELRIS